MNDKRPLSNEEKEKQKAVDDAYRSAMENFPTRKNRLIHGKASDQLHRGQGKE